MPRVAEGGEHEQETGEYPLESEPFGERRRDWQPPCLVDGGTHGKTIRSCRASSGARKPLADRGAAVTGW